MNKIFIEAKHNKTSEYHFIKAIIDKHFSDKEVCFVFMDGIDNLFKETIINQISLGKIDGIQTLVLADADTIAKGWGFEKRKEMIINGKSSHNVDFPFYLYPYNYNDGDVETLISKCCRRDLHNTFFDCFDDYEKCISGKKDDNGNQIYNTPNIKGKLHTYISSQQLNKKQRDKLGSGDWLFDDPYYWNLDAPALMPLIDFLAKNLK